MCAKKVKIGELKKITFSCTQDLIRKTQILINKKKNKKFIIIKLNKRGMQEK